MRYLSAAHTDVGISKQINQDAFGLKIAKTSKHNIAFAIMCDGMGGLKSGELASSYVINAFSNWFEKEFAAMMATGLNWDLVHKQWNDLAVAQGQKILNYGQAQGISLGTTLSAILIVDREYIDIQVGDSRIYKINKGIQQITKDQTVVARDVEMNRITAEQAKTDPRKNVLLQCIGASKKVEPVIERGVVEEEDTFLLCSDGFRHEISEEEIYGVAASNLLTSEKVMKKALMDLIELNKSRDEKDNITALLIKAIR